MSVGSCAIANIYPSGPRKLSILQPPDVFCWHLGRVPFLTPFPVKLDRMISLQLATVSSPVHEASLDFDAIVLVGAKP